MKRDTKEKALVLLDELEDVRLMELSEERRLAMGKQIQAILPQDFKNPLNALAFAFYCREIGANALREEIYGWEDNKGNLQVCFSYTALSRWAHGLKPFTHWFEDLEPAEIGAPKGALVVRCFILLDEKLPILEKLVKTGFPTEEAMNMVAARAEGIVEHHEMYYNDGNQKAPPKTWTWKTRAETRAFRHALKRSHGMPSTKELQETAWKVGDVQTIPSDWVDISQDQPGWVREKEAELAATVRMSKERFDQMTHEEQQAQLDATNAWLNGDPDFDLTDPDGTKKDNGPKLPADVKFPDWVLGLKTPKKGTPYIDLPIDQLLHILNVASYGSRQSKGARLLIEDQLKQTQRPYTPHELQAAVVLATGLGNREQPDKRDASDKQKNLLRLKLDEVFMDTNDPATYRHTLTKFLLGKASTEELKMSEARALIDKLLEKDEDTGDWFPQKHVVDEAYYIVRHEMEEAGQLDMFLERQDNEVDPEPDDDTDYYDEDTIPF